MGKQIVAAELSHENAPVHIREKMPGTEIFVREQLAILRTQVEEVFIVATCNRFAVYAVAESILPLQQFFSVYEGIEDYVQYLPSSEAATQHLFATASGLRSQVVGEHQILSQIKQAYLIAQETESIGLILDNLLREAIRVGKKVRTETGIDTFCTSIVDAGFRLVENTFPDIQSKTFLVIGTGKIARLALGYLKNEGASKVMIASHDFQRATELCGQYNAMPVDIHHLSHAFHMADVIVGGTHHEIALHPEMLEGSCTRHVFAYQETRKQIILDFGIPRNFPDSLREYHTVSLYNLDDLKASSQGSFQSLGSMQEAHTIVAQETAAFAKLMASLELSPILSAYWNRMVQIKDQELEWLLPKLGELSTREVDLIKRFAHKLIRSTSREPFKNLRSWAPEKERDIKVEIVKQLYSLEQVSVNIN